jgi:hypothetical protein
MFELNLTNSPPDSTSPVSLSSRSISLGHQPYFAVSLGLFWEFFKVIIIFNCHHCYSVVLFASIIIPLSTLQATHAAWISSDKSYSIFFLNSYRHSFRGTKMDK